MKLSRQQAAELAILARDLNIVMSNKSLAFCQRHGLDHPEGLDATLLTLLDSLVFLVIEAMFDDPKNRRRAADEMHREVKDLLRTHAIYQQVQKMNPT